MAITPIQALHGPFDPTAVDLVEQTIDERIRSNRGFTVSDKMVKLTIDPKIKGVVTVHNVNNPPQVRVKIQEAEKAELNRRYQLAGWKGVFILPHMLGHEVHLHFLPDPMALPIAPKP